MWELLSTGAAVLVLAALLSTAWDYMRPEFMQRAPEDRSDWKGRA